MPYLMHEEREDGSIGCKVMTAALDLFVENGYHNVSIHDIQRRAGVSIGSIYNHFGGKEGVALGLYRHLVVELEGVVDDVVASRADAESQCRELIVRLFAYTETHRNIMAFTFNARHREFLRDVPSICSSTPFAKMRDIVVRGMQQGAFRQANPWIAASSVFGGAIRLIQLRLDGLVQQPLTELADELIDTAWSGIRLKSSPQQCQSRSTAVA